MDEQNQNNGNKLFEGETQHGQGPWCIHHTTTTSLAQAIRNLRIQHNLDNQRVLHAYVNVQNVREVK